MHTVSFLSVLAFPYHTHGVEEENTLAHKLVQQVPSCEQKYKTNMYTVGWDGQARGGRINYVHQVSNGRHGDTIQW